MYVCVLHVVYIHTAVHVFLLYKYYNVTKTSLTLTSVVSFAVHVLWKVRFISFLVFLGDIGDLELERGAARV